MTWTEFKILVGNIKDKEPTEFTGVTDANIIATKQDQAKRDMLLDLQEALRLDYDAEEFEDILDLHLVRLREALACKQLYWYFFEKDMGAGTINNERYKYYAKLYEQQRKLFASLRNNDVTRVSQVLRAVR